MFISISISDCAFWSPLMGKLYPRSHFCSSDLVWSFSLTLIWDGTFGWLYACYYALFL